ncbi:MAG: succinate dehydrogenase, hydrophobic membrane anchor protein [Gammaproteobacteria bacterium]|nr:succinate dehydrogenase, hydrophobic membrane anchor protein [Gammaproteobacteria bacterium]
MNLRSPRSVAVGLGSAKHGFSHWWWQRVTAVALIPLTLWFVYSIVLLMNNDYDQATTWLASPVNATLMLVFVFAVLFHAQTGLQVVIEDYIHTKWINLTLLLVVKFAAVIMAVLATISVLQVALGG